MRSSYGLALIRRWRRHAELVGEFAHGTARELELGGDHLAVLPLDDERAPGAIGANALEEGRDARGLVLDPRGRPVVLHYRMR
jgi:hypothetical protein